MYLNTAGTYQHTNNSDIKPDSLKDLTDNLALWLTLHDRTFLEHERVSLQIPVGILHWPEAYYDVEEMQSSADLVIEVAGLGLHMIIGLSSATDLSALKKTDKMEDGDDPCIITTVTGATLSPSDMRMLMVWLIRDIRPLEFVVRTSS